MALGDATIALPNSTGSNQLPLDIGSVLAFFSGIKGNQGLTNQAIQLADPIAPAQGQALKDLQTLQTNPASIFTNPLFTAAENVGAENISRQAGAADMASSGNRLADLFKFGQSSALDFYNSQYRNDLATLTGSPAAAGILTGQAQTQGNNLANGIAGIIPLIASLLGLNTAGGLGGLLGSAGSAIGKLFGGSSGGGIDLSTLLDQGGINAGSLDQGGTLGDLQTIDFGSGGGTVGDMAPVLDGFFQGGSGDIFQWTDTLGG